MIDIIKKTFNIKGNNSKFFFWISLNDFENIISKINVTFITTFRIFFIFRYSSVCCDYFLNENLLIFLRKEYIEDDYNN